MSRIQRLLAGEQLLALVGYPLSWLAQQTAAEPAWWLVSLMACFFAFTPYTLPRRARRQYDRHDGIKTPARRRRIP
jgi:hypothetical protein